MRLAVISDIHGNLIALKEVFKKIEQIKVDGIIWCGDYITDIPMTKEVLDFIREKSSEYNSWVIKGNRESYLIEYGKNYDISWDMKKSKAALYYTFKKLDVEDIKYIESLPDEIIVSIPGAPEIYVSHYFPKKEVDQKYIVFGHYHYPIFLKKKGKTILNPGSIGTPNTGDTGSDFLVLELEDGQWNAKFHHIDYDVEEAVKIIENSELMNLNAAWGPALIKSLRTGSSYTYFYVTEARRLSGKDNVDEIEPEIWAEARKKFNF